MMMAARRATSAIFLVCGTATSCWAPMVPFAKTRLRMDDGTLGLVLLALGGGSVLAMPLAGLAIHRWGSRPVIVATSLAACAVLPLLAAPASPALLGCTLFVFGAALGAMDVAMNAQAIAVQHAAGRPIMSAFHALFSIGGLTGAIAIALLLRAGLTLVGSAALLAGILLILALSQCRTLLQDRGALVDTTFTLVPSPRVLLLGGLCFISFLAEGAALDWSGVLLHDRLGVDLSSAGIGYAVFSMAMVVGRLTGDGLLHRFGARRVLRTGGTLAAAGFLAAAATPRYGGALAGFAVVGLGAANIVPVLFSASGRVPGVPPSLALATVTTIAYTGLLAGPALIGTVADLSSLPIALAVVAGLLAVIPLSANRVT
jgi:predicted MFS family arabinose efflux permease